MKGNLECGEMTCPKCNGIGKLNGWTCDLCGGKQHIDGEKGRAWIRKVAKQYMRHVANDVNLEDEMIEKAGGENEIC